MENPLQKPREEKPRRNIEVIAVFFQDENMPGPQLMSYEKYVHSLLNKYGDVISHEYRREKISPNNPLPQPRL